MEILIPLVTFLACAGMSWLIARRGIEAQEMPFLIVGSPDDRYLIPYKAERALRRLRESSFPAACSLTRRASRRRYLICRSARQTMPSRTPSGVVTTAKLSLLPSSRSRSFSREVSARIVEGPASIASSALAEPFP